MTGELHTQYLKLVNDTNTYCHLNDLSLIKISGPDAQKFLQGQLTCDLREITSAQSRLGAHCNAKGRVISLFRIFLFADAYYLLLSKSINEKAFLNLKKYAVFSKVTLTDATSEFKAVGIAGPTLTKLPDERTLPLETDTCETTQEYIVIRQPGHLQRFLLIGKEEAIESLVHKLTGKFQAINAAAWHWLDIMAGIPQLYPQTSELFTPHQLNLPELNAVSFTKGCYTGQEIIARMQYLGKLKQHMYKAKIDSNILPEPGTHCLYYKNQAAEVAGEVIDREYSFTDVILLVTLQKTLINEVLVLQNASNTRLSLLA